uniref:Prostate androgen-regulated mucin-like protein 1 n=1 Tax=Bos mutus grunniens TaxID=30521 RepID=A0A8B9Y532_BOSMU
MVCKTLFALCIFTAGLRLQSVSASIPSTDSLLAETTTPTAIWTSSPQSPPASPTSGPSNSSVLLDPTPVPTSLSTKNISTEPREEQSTSPASNWEGTDPSPTSGGVHLTPTPEEHSSDTPEAGVPTTGSQPPAESPTLTSPQAPASSPLPPSTSPPEVPSASISTSHSSAETSTEPTGAPTTPESHTEEHSSTLTPTSHASSESVPTEATPQATVPPKVTCILIDMETTTTSPGVIMQEVEHALSSGGLEHPVTDLCSPHLHQRDAFQDPGQILSSLALTLCFLVLYFHAFTFILEYG